MKRFWIVYVEGTSQGQPMGHPSQAKATKEALRLAGLNNVNGSRVYILEAIAYCQAEEAVPVLPPVSYHEMEE